MMFISLTEAQADHVRGSTGEHSALYPVALPSGTEWALPVAVLSDPAHAIHHEYLTALPKREIDASEWPVAEIE